MRISKRPGRGHEAAETRIDVLAGGWYRIASMGPRPRGRGNGRKFAEEELRGLLQWGRGHAAAETLYLAGEIVPPLPLQWGRGHAAAETVEPDPL